MVKKCNECKENKLDFNKDLFNREMPVCDKCEMKIKMDARFQLHVKKWIDVKESMPEEFLPVLVWTYEKPIMAYYNAVDKKWFEIRAGEAPEWFEIREEEAERIYDEVLYWFSFPVPPGYVYCDGCNVQIVREINLDNWCEACEDHYQYKNMG